MFRPLTCSPVAADAVAAIAAAKEAQKQANSVGGEWRDTGKMIKKAEKLLKEGKTEEAAKLAEQAEAQGMARARLYHEGLMAMERMAGWVKRCTHLLIPNNQTPVRDILAFSGFINEDGDYYFGDPLFPRISA